MTLMPNVLSTIALLCATAALAAAQQMPDLSRMAGRPLPAPELPAGTVSVRVVRERMGNNVADHPVTLKTGGTKVPPSETAQQTLSATTDAQGRAQFGEISPGTMVTAETIVDGETLRSQEFAVPADGGVRVALIAGIEAAAARERAAAEEGARQPARHGIVTFGGESRVILEFQDDNLQVFYLLDIVNGTRTPVNIGDPLVIELPAGATGAGAMEGSSPLALVQGDRIRIGGPFPPGSTQVQVGYRMPYSGDRLTIAQRWPAAIEQLFVAVEKVGALQIASPQFSQQQEAQAGGAPFLMATGGRLNAGDTLTLSLRGLPHHSTLLRDGGIAVGLLVLAVGLWFGMTGPARAGDDPQLAQRKDALFAELVALEEQHRTGRIAEGRYASRRQSLIGQLEGVMAALDRRPAGGGEDVASVPAR